MFWKPLPPMQGYNEKIFAASIDDVASEDAFKTIVINLYNISGNEKHIQWFVNFLLAVYAGEFPDDYKDRIMQLANYELRQTDEMRRERIAVLKHQGCKPQEIANMFKISRQAVYNNLETVENSGLRCALTKGELNDIKAFLRAYNDLTQHLELKGYEPNERKNLVFR